MKTYAARRASLIAKMQAMGGGVAIISTAPEVKRNSDVDYAYRHDSYFYYLSGFTEPEAVIVIIAGSTPQSILFCREKNLEREIWDGYRYGPEVARGMFGFDHAYPIDALSIEIPKMLANAPALFHTSGHSPTLDAQLHTALQTVRGYTRIGMSAPSSTHDLHMMLDEMRLVKDSDEIDIMRRAASISATAHSRAMRATRPGMREYQLEAELLHEFRQNGSQYTAYSSIVAAGANSCVLHYHAGDTILKHGDLVLIDAGCELDSYASDITRTYPANGIFSAPQKALYEIVLAAQAAAIGEIKPGKHFIDVHNAAVRVLAQGMLDTGLLDTNKVGTLDDVIAKEDYRQFYMHRTSHWIGMDVHDVGNQFDPIQGPAIAGEKRVSRTLQQGMALTVEPGLYVRPAKGVPEQYWNIGIRIEDDAVVTGESCEIISSAAPKSVIDIEALMKDQL